MFGSLPEIAEFSVGTDSAVRILPEFDKFSQGPEHSYDPSTKGPHLGLVLKSMTLPYAVCLQQAAASYRFPQPDRRLRNPLGTASRKSRNPGSDFLPRSSTMFSFGMFGSCSLGKYLQSVFSARPSKDDFEKIKLLCRTLNR